MKLLLTGGLGFIGSNFCRHILESKPDVELVNIDKIGIGANPQSLSDIKGNQRYRFVKGNICNSRLLTKLVSKTDVIVNIAAETHVDRSIANPKPFFQSNTLGTFTLLETIRKHNPKARLVHVSTDEVHGQALEGSFTEASTLVPSNPYSASKAAADMFVLGYCRTYGIDASITRCTNNFGPFQTPEKLIPKTIIRALRNLPVPIYGRGANVRDWIYVLDHCTAIETVLKKGKAGEVYNVSAGNETTNIEVVKEILRILGKPENLITFVEDRPGHDKRYSLNSEKLRTSLGWLPKHSFREALKSTVQWYKTNETWWAPLATEDILHPTPWKSSGAS